MLEMGRLRYFLTISLPSALVDIIPGLRIGFFINQLLLISERRLLPWTTRQAR